MIYIYRVGDEPIKLDVNTMEAGVFDNMNFHRCILSNLKLCYSSLVNCDFRNAELKCTCFESASLENASLIMVDSIMANYENARLVNANIRFSDLAGVNLKIQI